MTFITDRYGYQLLLYSNLSSWLSVIIMLSITSTKVSAIYLLISAMLSIITADIKYKVYQLLQQPITSIMLSILELCR